MDVDYLGSSFDFYYGDSEMIFTLRKQKAGAVDLLLYVFEPEQVHSLLLGRSLKLDFVAKGVIMSKNTKLPENPAA